MINYLGVIEWANYRSVVSQLGYFFELAAASYSILLFRPI